MHPSRSAPNLGWLDARADQRLLEDVNNAVDVLETDRYTYQVWDDADLDLLIVGFR